MTEDKTFELTEVGLHQAGKATLIVWLPFTIGLIGSFAYGIFIDPLPKSIFFHLRNAFILAFVVYGIRQLLNKNKTKDLAKIVLLRIFNGIFSIEIDDEVVFRGSLDELKAIRTLDPANTKNSIQGEIYVADAMFSFASNLNFTNKQNWDEFASYCKKSLHMAIKPVPFSIYTSNFQGIKYLEYYNPKNPLFIK